jgi:hypothetical protein
MMNRNAEKEMIMGPSAGQQVKRENDEAAAKA